MKQRFLQLIVGSVITASCLLTTELQAQNTFPANGSVGIGTTAPNTSSILELNSVTKGFLAPRMTKAQRDAIVNPAVGLMIYQTNNSAGYYFWNGTSWLSMRQSVVSKNLGNLTAPTAINTSLLPNTTGVIDLGEPNFAWRDLYLSGSIYKNGVSWISNSGTNNFWAGEQAGSGQNGSYANTGVGKLALGGVLSGGLNTAVGFESLLLNAGGNGNTGLGSLAMHQNVSGNNNVGIGYFANYGNSSGSNNVGVGFAALYGNQTGYSNVAIGSYAFYGNGASKNCVAIGDSALMNHNNPDPHFINGFVINPPSTAIGSKALFRDLNGAGNTAVGSWAMYNNLSGGFNTVMGSSALVNSNSSNNTSIGAYTLYSLTDGNDNTALGRSAGAFVDPSGDQNVAIGSNSLVGGRSYNVAIGYNTGASAGTMDNTTTIGTDARATATNMVRLGNIYVNSIGGQVTWTSLSDGRFKENIKEDVPGLAFINKLRPVTYVVNRTKLNDFLEIDKNLPEGTSSYKGAPMSETTTGFVAQEVEQAAKELNFDFSGVDKPDNNKDLYGLRYSEFVVPVVKAIQELDAATKQKDEKIEELEKALVAKNAQTEQLAKAIDLLTQRLDALQLDMNACCSVQDAGKVSTDMSATPSLTATPNPATSTTSIRFSQASAGGLLSITAANGSVVFEQTISTVNGSVEVDCTTLAAGVYTCKLTADGKTVAATRLAVTK
ncbi:MAG: tail fiber domain-containing protein [Bacteroidia bacterium]|nr:tail fiber domain-containing protein [Bacteroidia bacterium]